MRGGERAGREDVLRVHLLGGFRVSVGPRFVDDDAWRLRKSRALVKLLALEPRHRLHQEQVIDLLWPDLEPRAASNQLRKALHVARRAIDPDPDASTRYLVHRDELLALRPEVLWVDVEAFESAAATARRSADPTAYRDAVARYAGDLLPEDRYEEWVVLRQEHLREEFLSLLLELSAGLEARADLDGAVTALRRVVAIEPTHEEAQARLMRLHALAGRRHDALRQYELLRDSLRRELDVEPSVDTQRLFEEIHAGRSAEPELTADLWERVGDLRMLSGDPRGAAAAFRSALAIGGERGPRPRAGRLHRKSAQALLARHEPGEAAGHLAAAEAGLTGAGDEPERGRLLGVLASWHCEEGRLQDALEAAEGSLRIAEGSGDPAEVAAANESLAIVFHFRGEWRDGLHAEIERIGAAADDDPQLARVFDIHHCVGQYHLYGDDLFEDVEDYARRTLDLAVEKGARRAQAFAWCLLGESFLLRGHWDEAAGALERSGELHAELGGRSGALPWQRLAELSVYRGDGDAAQAYLRRGMAIATISAMAPHMWGRLYATAALDALERDDAGAALRAVGSAASAAARYGDCPSCSALLNPVAAEAHAVLGHSEEAAAAAEAARAVAAFWESSAWRAMAAGAAASASLARGDAEGAGRGFKKAADLYDRAGQPFWSARSNLHAALAASGEGQRTQLLRRAAGAFTRLGALRGERRALEALGVVVRA